MQMLGIVLKQAPCTPITFLLGEAAVASLDSPDACGGGIAKVGVLILLNSSEVITSSIGPCILCNVLLGFWNSIHFLMFHHGFWFPL